MVGDSARAHASLEQASLELGVIGNCAIAALIDEAATVSWLCLPRLDGEPVFNELVGGEGRFSVELNGYAESHQNYIRNTGVLETILRSEDGSAVKVTDFAPRFFDRGRLFRPASIVRRIEPVGGMPTIKIDLNPQRARGSETMPSERGVSHIRYKDPEAGFRITTDAPMSYVLDGRAFVLDSPISFILGPDESLSDNIAVIAHDWLERTVEHWRGWSRRLGTPA
ncbi:MAG: trehalase-like domain-containing protein, partial [Pseudomonadota bacterium]